MVAKKEEITQKLSLERIVLIILFGGNVTLGGILGFGGEEEAVGGLLGHPHHTPITETCHFKLAVCEMKYEIKCKE